MALLFSLLLMTKATVSAQGKGPAVTMAGGVARDASSLLDEQVREFRAAPRPSP